MDGEEVERRTKRVDTDVTEVLIKEFGGRFF